jgi:hypothetical protein
MQVPLQKYMWADHSSSFLKFLLNLLKTEIQPSLILATELLMLVPDSPAQHIINLESSLAFYMMKILLTHV